MLDPSGIAQQIWDMKYRLKEADGTPVDKTVEDTWRRVARALAAGEADPAAWEERFHDAMRDFVVLPAGRIVAGAGTGRKVTLFNCFVMGRIEDDMASIFEHLKEAALTMQQGGGIGYDFSTLRPKGAPVRGVQSDASGPVSFMDVWDAMCRTIMSAGSRRGAMMGTLRCDHPDIEAFIDAKRDPSRLRMFNLSVLVTDAFMTAVQEDGAWDLVFDGKVWRSLRARDLWNRIMQATYEVAEPGVVFIDRINALNNLAYAEDIIATNPCVTADTWVTTTEGPRQVADLVGRPFAALVDGEPFASGPEGFFCTGRKGVVRLSTDDGRSITLTPDHRLQLPDRTWRSAGSMTPGQRVRLHDHERATVAPEATIAAVVPAGEAEVYDVRVPGPNAFDANGFVAHNCGEQPLPAYGTCLLGSVNLARLVDRPFEEGAALDLDLLEERVRVAVRMLDAVIDVSGYPLPAQRAEALAKRRIGLGVTGLADALILCGARYGSADAVRVTEHWLARLRRAAYLASADLAAEKGSFPLFDRDRFLAAPAVQAIEEDVRATIAEKGMRNGLVTSIAPTGTISLYADNVSSGLEPVFSFTYTRRVLMPDGSRREETVADYAWRLFRHLHGEEAPLPPAFVSAMELEPRDHLVMQAAVQKYIDSGISKTINVPEDIPFEEFKDVYRQAYDLGCKGCTTYRPNVVTGAVLELARREGNAAAGPPSETLPPEAVAADNLTAPPARPVALPGYTYKLRWPESDHATYITINDVVEHGRRRPFEVFINSKNMEHYAWTVALTRMVSAVFRRGGDIGFVVEELKAVFDPRGGAWVDGRYVPSMLAAIGEVIETHMIRIGFLPPQDRPRLGNGGRIEDQSAAGDGRPRLRTCPKCGQPALVRQEGCDTCTSCGYSRCG